MVALHCSNWAGPWIRYATHYATNARCGRVGGVSVLFQDPGAGCAGTFPRVRQRSDRLWNEAGPGGWHAWRRPVDGKLRMAAGLHGNRLGEPGLVTRLDEVDAAC